MKRPSSNGTAPRTTHIHGTPVSRGVAVGKVVLITDALPAISQQSVDPSIETARFHSALDRARNELIELTDAPNCIASPVADILDVHLLILDSASFVERVESVIRSDNVAAEHAIATVADEIAAKQAAAPDKIIAEKAIDIRDAARRVSKALDTNDRPSPAEEGCVFVVQELSPHMVLELAAQKPAAILAERGGWTSHASIIARELKIPVVTGVADVPVGANVLVNAIDGEIIVEPGAVEIQTKLALVDEEQGHAAGAVSEEPLRTADGTEIVLRVNADNADTYEAAARIGGRGIGLFRSEVILGRNKGFPTEEEQYQAYCRIADAAADAGVRIRTFDVGTEQIAGGNYLERNPSLGLKSIRLSLTETEYFRTQIRALLRASYGRNVSIVLPMISGVGEIVRSKAVIGEERSHLDKIGTPHGDPSIGVMIEVPSAVLMAREICEHSDFLCLGTNDLVQYLLTVDRDNEAVAEWYQSLHPAVIRALESVVAAANEAGVPAAVCGEIAGSPFYVPLLLGLGIRELSVNVHSIQQVRRIVAGIDLKDAQRLADSVRSAQTSADSEELLRDHYQQHWADLFPVGLLEAKHR